MNYPMDTEYPVRLIPPFRPKAGKEEENGSKRKEPSAAVDEENNISMGAKGIKKRKVLQDVSNKNAAVNLDNAESTGVRKSTRLASKKKATARPPGTDTLSQTNPKSPTPIRGVETRRSKRLANSERKKPIADVEFAIKKSNKRRRKSEPGTLKQVSATSIIKDIIKNPQPVVAGPSCPAVHHELPLPKGVEDIDLRHYNDIAYCRNYVKDIYSYLRSQQFKYPLEEHFLVEKQPDLNAHMRGILIDWLVEVADEYKLLPDTLYLSVTYIDRALNCFPVERSNLQLLGCACLLLASKYEEIYPPAVDELAYISDHTYSREQIIRMESKVLKALDYKLNAVTIKLFLRRFQRAAQVQREEKNLCNYLAELTLLEIEMVKFTPSLIAASALYLARLQLYPDTRNTNKLWTEELKHYTDYSVDEMARCVREIHKIQSLSGKNNLKSIYEKYSCDTFSNASILNFVPTRYLPTIKPCAIKRGGR